MKTWIVLIPFLLLLSAAKTDHTDSPFPLNKANSGLISLPVSNGNLIQIFQYAEAGMEHNLIIESGECERCSSLDLFFKTLGKKPTAEELIWALTPRSRNIEDAALHNKFASDVQQNWLNDLIAKNRENGTEQGNSATDLACGNNSFKSSIAGGFHGSVDYIRLDKRPNNYSNFNSDCYNPAVNGQCWGAPRYRLSPQFTNIRSWRGKVCCRSVQTAFNDHIVKWCGSGCSTNPGCEGRLQDYCSIYRGPEINFEYYWNGHWRLIEKNGALASYDIPANETKVYQWFWETSSPTAFRIDIRYAKPYDEFDIMMDK